MSMNLYLICTTCVSGIWIGQQDYDHDRGEIYTGEPDTMNKLASFLLSHKANIDLYEDHSLSLIDEHHYNMVSEECIVF